jgi:hypothetical protein
MTMIETSPGPGAVGRRRSALLMIIVAVIGSLLLAGCVSVPTAGKVEVADQGTGIDNTRPEAVPKPPVHNASPRVIIDGFLFAMSRWQANYEIARQFLATDVRDSWRPEDQVLVYTSPKYDSTESNVTLTVNRVGVVNSDGSYSATSGTQVQDFQMIKDKSGQWRIGNPPDGLLISDTSFSATYASYNLYFFDPQFRTLVPDPIYLPIDSRTETALVQALLRGPTSWLQSAVSTAFPPRTSLVGDAVAVSNTAGSKGLAQISLSPSVLALNDQQRIRLAAQLAWTLSQLSDSGIRGMQLMVNGARFRVPRQIGDGDNAYLPISYGDEYAPVPASLSSSLLAVRNDAVVAVDNDGARLTPLAGRLGRPGAGVDSLALSADGREIAAVTDGRTNLRTQAVDDKEARILLTGQAGLLRPDFSRYGELWVVSGSGRQTIRMIKDRKAEVVRSPWLSRVHITAFQISPDGSRMALVGRSDGQQVLGVAPIMRGDQVALGNIRFVQLADTATAQVQRLADLGWISPTRLLILGAGGTGTSFEPYGVEIDGSQFERVGTSDNWGATTLATGVEPGGSFHAVVAGQHNKTWIYRSGDQWDLLSDNLTRPAYAG